MATYYLTPGHEGTNSGTESNPFNSWREAFDYVNLNHSDMVTAQEGVDILVNGPVERVSGASLLVDVICSAEYPLRFIGVGTSPTQWDETKPGLEYVPAGASGIGFSVSGLLRHVRFEKLQFKYDPSSGTSSQNAVFFISQTPDSLSLFTLDKCYVTCMDREDGHPTAFRAFIRLDSDLSFSIQNCIFEGWNADEVPILRSTRSSLYPTFVNCTFVNNSNFIIGSTIGTRSVALINNLYIDTNTEADLYVTKEESGKNATNWTDQQVTLQGSDNTYGVNISFPVGGPYLLTSNNDLAAGPDDLTYGEFVPQFDILGSERTGETADVGAHEFGGVSGPSISAGTVVNQALDGFQVRFTTDVASGTAYYVVQPLGTSDPTAEQIKDGLSSAGTAALAADSMEISTTGEQTFPAVTGLDPGTTYRVAVVHYSMPV